MLNLRLAELVPGAGVTLDSVHTVLTIVLLTTPGCCINGMANASFPTLASTYFSLFTTYDVPAATT